MIAFSLSLSRIVSANLNNYEYNKYKISKVLLIRTYISNEIGLLIYFKSKWNAKYIAIPLM